MSDIKDPKPDKTSDEKELSDKKNLATDDEGHPLANTDFMREKIKARPINSKKLLRRTIITIVLAALFGIVACCTFLLLEPLINNTINPDDNSGGAVSFPSEAVSDEIQRQDLIASEEEKAAADAASAQASATETAEKEIAEALDSYKFSASDYSSMYGSLKEIAETAQKSIVTVTGATSDKDWINDSFIRSNSASGIIVAGTDSNMLILSTTSKLSDADKIMITFSDSSSVEGTLKTEDPITGLCILSVPIADISEDTMDTIAVATLGSSASSSLIGTPVIALGAPTGTDGSICYGAVTSSKQTIDLPDCAYKLLTTDIYSSTSAGGVLINLDGSVIGIIDMNYNADGQENLLSAIGITELKTLIQNLSNGVATPYIGIHATDVPAATLAANKEMPEGAYVTKIEMGSPAMDAGIQSGDIITAIDGTKVTTYSEFLTALSKCSSTDTVKITLQRQGQGSYTKLTVDATLSDVPSDFGK